MNKEIEEEIRKVNELSKYCALKNIDRDDEKFGEFVVAIQKLFNYIKDNTLKLEHYKRIHRQAHEECSKWKQQYRELEKNLDKVVTKLADSTPNSVIREKKEELEKQYKEALEENSTKAFILKCQLEILEEILKEGEK